MTYKQTYLGMDSGHPRACKGWVYTHILVAEKALGKYLKYGHEVHHVDGNKQNNQNSNLVICENRSYHKLLHTRQKIQQVGLDPNNYSKCTICKYPLDKACFSDDKSRHRGKNFKCNLCTAVLARQCYLRKVNRAKI